MGGDSVYGFLKYNGGYTQAVCSPTLNIYMSTVGLKETIRFSNFKMYPNPTKDKLRIEFTDFEPSDLKLELLNSLGQLVYETDRVTEKQEIDLSSFPNGIYFLRLQNSETQKVYKVIKN